METQVRRYREVTATLRLRRLLTCSAPELKSFCKCSAAASEKNCGEDAGEWADETPLCASSAKDMPVLSMFLCLLVASLDDRAAKLPRVARYE